MKCVCVLLLLLNFTPCAYMCVELLLCLRLRHKTISYIGTLFILVCVCVRTDVCMCVCVQVYVNGCR